MKKFLLFVTALVVILAALAIFLVATTPHQTAGIRFPLGARERALIAEVPASAEAFVVIPTAAALDAKLHANPITRNVMTSWTAGQSLPRPWMIGSADLVAWRSGKQTHYFLLLDALRATVVRMFNTGGAVMINATGEPPIDSAAISQIIDLASRLPPGDALVVQRQAARGAYPPIGRPVVTSVSVSDSAITMTSVAEVTSSSAPSDRLKPVLHFPRSAVLSAAFVQPPRVIADLNRLFGAKVSTLFDDGGMVAIYNVDSHKLLPRPLGVIALHNDPQKKAIVDSFRQAEAIGIRMRTAEIGDTLALSFDDSIDQYQQDVFEQAPAGNLWSMRIDPQRLVPILNDLGQNIGLRIAAPRLFRSARDLATWIGGLEQAKTIEATDSTDGSIETLQVHIATK